MHGIQPLPTPVPYRPGFPKLTIGILRDDSIAIDAHAVQDSDRSVDESRVVHGTGQLDVAEAFRI